MTGFSSSASDNSFWCLVADPNLGVGDKYGIHYSLRPSMIKFADISRMAETIPLDVCDWSGPASIGKLNIQLISILEHLLELDHVEDDCNPILNAVKGAVKQWEPLAQVIRDIAKSNDVDHTIRMCSNLWKSSAVAQLIYAGFDPKDIHILNQLAALCSSDLNKLNEKYNVPIRESRRCADPIPRSRNPMLMLLQSFWSCGSYAYPETRADFPPV
jgi:hypothetical protein